MKTGGGGGGLLWKTPGAQQFGDAAGPLAFDYQLSTVDCPGLWPFHRSEEPEGRGDSAESPVSRRLLISRSA